MKEFNKNVKQEQFIKIKNFTKPKSMFNPNNNRRVGGLNDASLK